MKIRYEYRDFLPILGIYPGKSRKSVAIPCDNTLSVTNH